MLGKDGVLGEGKPRFRVEGCPSPKNEASSLLKLRVGIGIVIVNALKVLPPR